MKCPYCGYLETKVVDKRETQNNEITRRRRECLSCKKRFTTYEKSELIQLIVIKKDGRKEPYDLSKIEKGILKACEKRPITIDTIKNMLMDIDYNLKNKGTTEISSSYIGKLVMNKLKKLDKVAYIRFASVYKDFKDPEEFEEELKKLTKSKKTN
ncbi:MAG: transcriptional regulator NrdR [Candidatus Woesearchaeota archaeon]